MNRFVATPFKVLGEELARFESSQRGGRVIVFTREETDRGSVLLMTIVRRDPESNEVTTIAGHIRIGRRSLINLRDAVLTALARFDGEPK